jgi:hypothetical protein
LFGERKREDDKGGGVGEYEAIRWPFLWHSSDTGPVSSAYPGTMLADAIEKNFPPRFPQSSFVVVQFPRLGVSRSNVIQCQLPFTLCVYRYEMVVFILL